MPDRQESGGRGRGAGRGRALALHVAVLVPGLLLLAGGAVSAAAQPETCPNPGPQAVTVTLSAPEAGATVSGVVQVEGTVESTEPVFRVELFVGDARKAVAFQEPPATTASFVLRWDGSTFPPGPATIRVLACGGQVDQGSLVRGGATVDVTVVAPATGVTTGGTLLPAGGEDVVSRAPAWVGLVVGTAGLAGLAVASGVGQRRPGRRRSRSRGPQPG